MERRTSSRQPVRLPVRFRSATGASGHGFSVDLSDRGAFIRTASLLPLGARLELEIGHGAQLRRHRAAVVRIFSVPFGDNPEPVSGMGVRFL
jgi:hypothetical protein